MNATANKPNDSTLRALFATVVSAMTETLKSLVDRELTLTPGDLFVAEPADVLGRIELPQAVVRAALDKDFAGKTLRVLIDARDAMALSGALMMTPADVIDERRSSCKLEGEDLDAFGEVANVLCSGIDQALRGAVRAAIGLRLQDHGLVQPGADEQRRLGDEPLVGFAFRLKIGAYPPTQGAVLVAADTAERWNGRPLALLTPPATEKEAAPADEIEQEIPQAPIRGRVAAFLCETDTLTLMRKSARRVGLELDRHAKTDIPNPAAHKGQVVVLEIPTGDERRFDWCKRLKLFPGDIRVVLILHHPSRARVLQGFMAKADAILGWPMTEPVLSAKLETVLGPAPAR